MSSRIAVALLICVGLSASLPATASHLVTGNGFGFAVVAPENGTVTKFYAHPYSFLRPDPKDALSEGVETTNFIKSLGIGEGVGTVATSAEYVEDSHVIRVKGGGSEGLVFMPFGLKRAALVLVGDAGTGVGVHVEWSHAVKSSRKVRMQGAEMKVVTF